LARSLEYGAPRRPPPGSPRVSMKEITGRWNFSASASAQACGSLPDGVPKLRLGLLQIRPFWWPIPRTVIAMVPTPGIALSSPKRRSPCSSTTREGEREIVERKRGAGAGDLDALPGVRPRRWRAGFHRVWLPSGDLASRLISWAREFLLRSHLVWRPRRFFKIQRRMVMAKKLQRSKGYNVTTGRWLG